MAGNAIKVTMDVSDVKAGGLALIERLQGSVDATLKLAEAQVKYNKTGKEVATVLKGLTDAGERHTVTLKKLADGYELVNASVSRAKTSLGQLKTASEELAKAERERAQLNARLEVAGRRGMAAQQLNDAADYQKWLERNASNTNSPSNRPPPGGGFGGGPPMGGGADDLAKKTERATKAGERLFITWQGIVRLVEAMVVKKVITEIGSAFASSINDAKNFSIAIAEIRTISQDMPQSVEKWREQVTRLSGQFGQTQTDVANAAYETLSNQIAKGPEAIEFLSTALKFGAATVTNTTDSVNLLSSAIKSFNLPVEDAERVASILFKTIDLGRIRAKDLANTFGRVGSVANQAGVKLEEVAAALATITIRGVTPADAMTVLTNLLNQLIKPTDAMKDLFREWGVASGEAAIATFGFEGVLAKLNEESKKGASRVGELFTNIRSLRGAFQLSGEGFSDYQKGLQKITNGQKEYNKAAKEVLESPGKQLEIAGQKLKNLFTEDFGKNVVEFLVKMNNLLETSKDSADGLVNSVKVIITTLTVGAGILVAIKVLQIANITATLTWSQAFSGLVANMQRGLSVLSAYGPFLALAAAAFLTHQAIVNANDTGRGSGDIDAQLREEQRVRNEKAKARLVEQGDPEAEAVQKLKASIDTRYQFLLNYTTKAVKLSGDLKQRTIDQYKDITDAVKISSKTYFDSIINKMAELKRASTEAHTLIRQSLKLSEDLGRRTTQTVFDARMKYASEGRLENSGGSPVVVDNQRVELLQNRIAALLVEARVKAKVGTKEAFEESRRLYDDVQRLMAQLFEAKTNTEKRVFDERVSRGLEQPTRMSFDPRTGELRAQFEFVAKTAEFEKEMLTLGKERLGNERQFRDLQKQRSQNAEMELSREKERLRGLQQAFDTIQKIEVFTKEGNVKDEYKKDPALAARQFDEQATKIRSLAGQEGFGTQYQVFQDLQKQRLALVQQVETSIRAERAQSLQQELIRNKQGTQQLIDGANTQAAAGRKRITDGMDQLERDLAVIEERTLRPQLGKIMDLPFGMSLTTGGDSIASKLLGKIPGVEKSGFDRAEPDRQAALQALAAVREAQSAFNADRTAAKLDLLKKKLVELKEAARKYVETFTGESPDNIAEQGDHGKTQGERIGSLDVGALVSQEGLGKTESAAAQLERAANSARDLDVKIKTLPGGVEFFAKTVAERGPDINKSFTMFTLSALSLTDQMKALNAELARAADLLPKIRGDREKPVEGNRFGGPPKYFAFGGPVGTDRVPAMLGEDEFVMTGAATKAFAPLLKQMNSYPSRAGGSGSSVTNIGDINVTVNGGDTSAKTINEIGVGLRRGLARGTVKLNG